MQAIPEILKAEEPFLQARNSTPKSSMTGQESECPDCSDTGWVPIDSADGYGKVRMCECEKRRRSEERIRVVLQDWPEYKDASLATLKPRNVGQANAITAIRGDPYGSYFITGYFSRGKTSLLVAQYKFLALAGEKCLLRSMRDLMKELQKAEISPNSDREAFESPVLQMVNLAPRAHLLIDDVEKAPVRSGFRAETLFNLLDVIKRRMLGLSVTSNLPMISKDPGKPDLRKYLGEEVVSRLYRICRAIEL